MNAAKLDLTAFKGSVFIEEFQLVDSAGNPRSLVNKQVRFVCKESLDTETELFNFLPTISDASLGMFKVQICAADTDISSDTNNDFTSYQILMESTLVGEVCQTECLVFGNLLFTRG